jgi:N utilization substance protein B
MEALRTETDQVVDAVLSEREAIDGALEQIVENFAPERIDPIDRAILRLATWEIRHNINVPKPVAINEAVELAKKFGTTDSGRFVNGILDKVTE